TTLHTFKEFKLLRVMLLLALFFVIIFSTDAILETGIQLKVDEFFEAPGHTNNWAVLVDTSRFWFNYRHSSNVLSLYHSIKRLGIPDSNIIVMLAEDIPCNSRNPKPGTVFNSPDSPQNLYGEEVEVDYRGAEVTVENFVRVLTGRHHESTPRNKRLLSNHQSNVLIYLTGHGGDSFIKFQDTQELTNAEIGNAVKAMYEHNRYHEVFFIADTCRSASLYEWISSPGVLSTSSSLTHEESYSYDIDEKIGVYVIDRYSHFTLRFFDTKMKGLNSTASMQDYLEACNYQQCLSTVGVNTDNYAKDPRRVRATDFFGSKRMIRYLEEEIILDDEWMEAIEKHIV
ncbi:hypothetical protein PFISCL1PPCAC_10799, partial [Pristionchus fissidentatus]